MRTTGTDHDLPKSACLWTGVKAPLSVNFLGNPKSISKSMVLNLDFSPLTCTGNNIGAPVIEEMKKLWNKIKTILNLLLMLKSLPVFLLKPLLVIVGTVSMSAFFEGPTTSWRVTGAMSFIFSQFICSIGMFPAYLLFRGLGPRLDAQHTTGSHFSALLTKISSWYAVVSTALSSNNEIIVIDITYP